LRLRRGRCSRNHRGHQRGSDGSVQNPTRPRAARAGHRGLSRRCRGGGVPLEGERWGEFEWRRDRYGRNIATLDRTLVRSASGSRLAASQLLKQPEIRLKDLGDTRDVSLDLHAHSTDLDLASVETAVKYAGYLKQESARAERAKKEERRVIPPEFPFSRVPGLSTEVVHRLTQVRPETLGQASRIPGITPAAIAV